MTYIIGNSRIYIGTKNQPDQVGILHHSVHSHRLRKMIVCILEKIVPCFHRNFTFDTFEVKLENRIVYLNKGDYRQWRESHFSDLPLLNKLEEDLLKLIEIAKKSENILSKETLSIEPVPLIARTFPELDPKTTPSTTNILLIPASKPQETPKNPIEQEAERIFTNFDEMRAFFARVGYEMHHLTMFKMEAELPLIKALIQKCLTIEDFSEFAKKDPFGLVTEINSLEASALIGLLLEEMPFDKAFIALTGVFYRPNVQAWYIIKVLVESYSHLYDGRQPNQFSASLLHYTLDFFDILKASEKIKPFFEASSFYVSPKAAPPRYTQAFHLFENSLVTAFFKFRFEKLDETLDDLQELSYGVILDILPEDENFNPFLEQNLTSDEKKQLFQWLNSDMTPVGLDDEELDRDFDSSGIELIETDDEEPRDKLVLLFSDTKNQYSEEDWCNTLHDITLNDLEQVILTYIKGMNVSHYYGENFLFWIRKIYSSSNEDQRELLISKLVYPQVIAFCFPEDSELVAKIADKMFCNFIQMQAFFTSINAKSPSLPSMDIIKPLIKALTKKVILHSNYSKNPFGLNPYNGVGVIKLISEDAEDLFDIIKPNILKDDFHPDFCRAILNEIFEIEMHPSKYTYYSYKFLEFFIEIDQHERFFRDTIRNENTKQLFFANQYKEFEFTKKFISESIVGILTYKSDSDKKQRLDLLMTLCPRIMTEYIIPKFGRPNPVFQEKLDENLKLKFLQWVKSQTSNISEWVFFD